jgi:hypothetical protein
MTLIDPDVRLLENAAGIFNTDSIGGPPGQHNSVSLRVASLFVKSVEVDDGTIHYSRAGQQGAPIEIHHLDGRSPALAFSGECTSMASWRFWKMHRT